MNEQLAIIAITILAVISPGPDFAMVTRNSYRHGRRSGLLCALGVGLGVQVHVFYTVLGVAVIITRSPLLFGVMKALGAAYLIYIGLQSVRNAAHTGHDESSGGAEVRGFAALRTGFLTNALNPKTMLFVVSAYTQIVHGGTPLRVDFLYGLFMSFAHVAWFGVVALFFSTPALRAALLRRRRVLDRVIGGALIVLGTSLFFAHANR